MLALPRARRRVALACSAMILAAPLAHSRALAAVTQRLPRCSSRPYRASRPAEQQNQPTSVPWIELPLKVHIHPPPPPEHPALKDPAELTDYLEELQHGFGAKFDPLRPPDLPPLDAHELGIGAWDNRLEENRLDPVTLADPTNRSWQSLVQLVENAGYVTAARAAVIGSARFIAPSADVLAAGSIEVDLSPISVGDTHTVKWRGKPVFIRHRTAKEIDQAHEDDNLAANGLLRDPEYDRDRVKRDDWLVIVGICTHLGCVPISQAGDYHGFFCPCHGSHYDTSARIRKGPAPLNMEVPHYHFINDTKIRLGD